MVISNKGSIYKNNALLNEIMFFIFVKKCKKNYIINLIFTPEEFNIFLKIIK